MGLKATQEEIRREKGVAEVTIERECEGNAAERRDR